MRVLIIALVAVGLLVGCKSSILSVNQLKDFEMGTPRNQLITKLQTEPYSSVNVDVRKNLYYVDFYSLDIGQNSSQVFSSKYYGDSRLGTAGMKRSQYVRPTSAVSSRVIFLVIYDDSKRLLLIGPQEDLLKSEHQVIVDVTKAAIDESVAKRS